MFNHVIGHASETHRGKLGEDGGIIGDLTWATSYVLAFAATLQSFYRNPWWRQA